MCVHIIPAFLPCVSEFSPPRSQVVSPKHLKVGGPIEPLKAVINKRWGEPAWAVILDLSLKNPDMYGSLT